MSDKQQDAGGEENAVAVDNQQAQNLREVSAQQSSTV
jgi:hypothetical protein